MFSELTIMRPSTSRSSVCSVARPCESVVHQIQPTASWNVLAGWQSTARLRHYPSRWRCLRWTLRCTPRSRPMVASCVTFSVSVFVPPVTSMPPLK